MRSKRLWREAFRRLTDVPIAPAEHKPSKTYDFEEFLIISVHDPFLFRNVKSVNITKLRQSHTRIISRRTLDVLDQASTFARSNLSVCYYAFINDTVAAGRWLGTIGS